MTARNLTASQMNKTEKKADELSEMARFIIGLAGSFTALVLVGLVKLFFEYILK